MRGRRGRRIAPELLRIGRRVSAILFRIPVEREVEDEVDFHVRMRVREFVRAGMSEEDARRAALVGFGDLDRLKADLRRLGEEREGRMIRMAWWDDVRQDTRLAVRQIVRRPGFAVVAILTLALAIGANTAVFSVVNGVLLRPLPYRDPDELVALWTRYLPSSGLDIPQFPLSAPEVLDYRDQSRALEGVAPYATTTVALDDVEGDPERIRAVAVGRGLFGLLGAGAAMGRVFGDDDHAVGNGLTLLSHALWVRRFGAAPDIVGRAIELNGASSTVIGVMPEGFVFPAADTELWVPLMLDEQNPGGRGGHGLAAVGRLADGVTFEQAEAELETITAGWNEQYEHHAMGHFIFLRRYAEDVIGDARSVLVLLGVAVGLVLLIACGNVANLFLTRGEARQGEMAVRAALGAGRGRLARQLLVEGMVVSLAGAAAGLGLAWIALPALLAIDPTALPRSESVGLDGRVLGFTAVLVVLTTLAFGLASALSRSGSMASHGRGWTEGRGPLLRRLLVGGEVALGLVVVMSAGLVTKSLGKLRSVDAGVRTERLLTFGLSLPAASYPDPEPVARFYDELLGRLRALPGVEMASAVGVLPLTGSAGRSDFLPEGEAPPADGVPRWNAQVVAARPDYFATAGVPLLGGRLPAPSDGPESFPVAVVNEALVRRYFPEGSPVGRRFTFVGGDPLWITVIGVVGDTRHDPREAPEPILYLDHAQVVHAIGGGRALTLVVRAGGDPHRLVPALRGAVAELDPKLPLSNLRTFEEVAARSVARPTLTAGLLGAFALLATLLAALGIYGVASYTVARRSREIALRMALGAARRRVIGMVVADGARPVLAGTAVGLGAALLLSKLLESLLFGVSPTDPLTFAAVPSALLAIAFLATWIPARRATRVEPSQALRED